MRAHWILAVPAVFFLAMLVGCQRSGGSGAGNNVETDPPGPRSVIQGNVTGPSGDALEGVAVSTPLGGLAFTGPSGEFSLTIDHDSSLTQIRVNAEATIDNMLWKGFARLEIEEGQVQSGPIPLQPAGPLFEGTYHFPRHSVDHLMHGDWNEDGALDLAVLGREGADDGSDPVPMLSVVRNRGDGTWLRGWSTVLDIQSPQDVQVRDVNGDLHEDLLILSADSHLDDNVPTVNVQLGTGEGEFVPGVALWTNDFVAAGVRQITCSDIDLDGDQDLILGLRSGQIRVAANDGFGNWLALQEAGSATNGLREMLMVDLNLDGVEDLLALGTDSLSFLGGTGTQSFAPEVRSFVSSEASGVTLGNVDEDPELEAVVTAGQEVVILENSAGTFAAEQVIDVGVSATHPQLLSHTRRRSPDLLLRTGERPTGWRLEVLRSREEGFETSLETLFSGVLSVTGVLVADVDDDRARDLIVSQGSLVLSFPGEGDGSFELPVSLEIDSYRNFLGVTDFDADSLQEIVMGNDLLVEFFELDGRGSATKRLTLDVNEGVSAVASLDLDQDGDQDILCYGHSSFSRRAFLQEDEGSFSRIPFEVDAGGGEMQVQDLNGDGRKDVVLLNSGGRSVSVLLNDPQGLLLEPLTYPVGSLPNDLEVRDFNGDGILDLVVLSRTDYIFDVGSLVPGSLSLLRGRGDGSFGPNVRFEIAGDPRHVDLGELTGDGIVDLVVLDQEQSTLTIWQGDGSGRFRTLDPWNIDVPGWSLKVADVTGDGVSDLLVGCGGVSVLRGDGAGQFSSIGTFRGDCDDGILDIDGDGDLDMVVETAAGSSDHQLLFFENRAVASQGVEPGKNDSGVLEKATMGR